MASNNVRRNLFKNRSETYQNRRYLSCKGKNISTRNYTRTSIFHRSLDLVHNIQTSYWVVVWESLLLTFYCGCVVQQNWCITALHATNMRNILINLLLINIYDINIRLNSTLMAEEFVKYFQCCSDWKWVVLLKLSRKDSISLKWKLMNV